VPRPADLHAHKIGDLSYLTHKFNDLVEDTGLPPVRLHDLRHGAAARLVLNAGKSPPGGGACRRSAPVLAEITA